MLFLCPFPNDICSYVGSIVCVPYKVFAAVFSPASPTSSHIFERKFIQNVSIEIVCKIFAWKIHIRSFFHVKIDFHSHRFALKTFNLQTKSPTWSSLFNLSFLNTNKSLLIDPVYWNNHSGKTSNYTISFNR